MTTGQFRTHEVDLPPISDQPVRQIVIDAGEPLMFGEIRMRYCEATGMGWIDAGERINAELAAAGIKRKKFYKASDWSDDG